MVKKVKNKTSKNKKKEQVNHIDKVSNTDKSFAVIDEIIEEEKRFRFDELSFSQWYKIVQYIVNYDIVLSNLERLDSLIEKREQLKAFLDSHGVIPAEYHQVLAELNNKYQEMLNIQNEISFSDKELSKRISDEKLLKTLQDELKNQVINKENLKLAKKHVLFFRNPYFLNNSDNQYFDERKKALLIEYKNIKSSIRQIKPHIKKYNKSLNTYEEQVAKALLRPDFDFKQLFNYVRPFIPEIIESQDFYYSELVTLSMLD